MLDQNDFFIDPIKDSIHEFANQNRKPCTVRAFNTFISKNKHLSAGYFPDLLRHLITLERSDILNCALTNGGSTVVNGNVKPKLKSGISKDTLTKALFTAVEELEVDSVRLLVDLAADVNASNDSGTPLRITASSANDSKIRMTVLSKKQGINDVRLDLHTRAKDIVEILLNNGATIYAGNNILNGGPLHVAAAKGNSILVDFLINRNDSNINELDYPSKRTPLHCAAMYGNCEVINLLLNKGANVNAKDLLGNTPLHYAAEHQELFTSKELIESKGKIDAVKLLVSKGADVYSIFHPPLSSLYVTALEAVPNDQKYDELRSFLKEQQTSKAYIKHAIKNPVEFLTSNILPVLCFAAIAIGIGFYVHRCSTNNISIPSSILKDMLNLTDKVKSFMH